MFNSRSVLRKWALLGAALALTWAAPVSAQVLYGSLVGTVTDATGAVVPGAQVSAVNLATGLELDTASGADGSLSNG